MYPLCHERVVCLSVRRRYDEGTTKRNIDSSQIQPLSGKVAHLAISAQWQSPRQTLSSNVPRHPSDVCKRAAIILSRRTRGDVVPRLLALKRNYIGQSLSEQIRCSIVMLLIPSTLISDQGASNRRLDLKAVAQMVPRSCARNWGPHTWQTSSMIARLQLGACCDARADMCIARHMCFTNSTTTWRVS